ncbi:MAG: hypothetical protein QOH51_186 [Acidobacteriota bacterium]|nr:hypothetical protein [Acidobacteriota bacterium]
MSEIRWELFPLLAALPQARAWLALQAALGLAPNTVAAYGRALEDYLTFCERNSMEVNRATREQLASYVGDLARRPSRHGAAVRRIDSMAGLANATLRLRLTAVRLYYDHLIEEGCAIPTLSGAGVTPPVRALGSVSGASSLLTGGCLGSQPMTSGARF